MGRHSDAYGDSYSEETTVPELREVCEGVCTGRHRARVSARAHGRRCGKRGARGPGCAQTLRSPRTQMLGRIVPSQATSAASRRRAVWALRQHGVAPDDVALANGMVVIGVVVGAVPAQVPPSAGSWALLARARMQNATAAVELALGRLRLRGALVAPAVVVIAPALDDLDAVAQAAAALDDGRLVTHVVAAHEASGPSAATLDEATEQALRQRCGMPRRSV